MKERSIVEVMVCLLESVAINPVDIGYEFFMKRLENAGFSTEDVFCAFDWLKTLLKQHDWYNKTCKNNLSKTFRIFNNEEIYKISTEARNFILSLEQGGVLDTGMREIIINQLMQLNQDEVNLTDTKWIIFLVLISSKNKKRAKQISDYLLIATN